MGGDLVVAPALLVVATQWPFRELRGRVVEAAALAAATAGLAVFMFTRPTSLTFLIFPVLVWAALRFWRLGAVVAILLFASIAIPLTESDMGPFSGEAPDDSLLLAQLYLGVAGLTALVLAAVVTQRQRSEDNLEHIASTLQESLLPHPPRDPRGRGRGRLPPRRRAPPRRWRLLRLVPERRRNLGRDDRRRGRKGRRRGRNRSARPPHAARSGDPGVASEPDPPVPERRRSARVSRSDMHSRVRPHRPPPGGQAGSCCPSAGIHRRSCFGPMAASSRWVAVAYSACRRTPSWLTTESIWPRETRWCCTRTGSRTRPRGGW